MLKIFLKFTPIISGINKRIFKGVFWSLVGSVFSKIIVLGSTIIISRLLGKELYGKLAIINSTIQFFLVFAAFGIGTTASRYIAEYRDTNTLAATKIHIISTIFAVSMATIISLLVVLMAPILATNSLGVPELTGEIRIAGIMLFFSTLNGMQSGTLAGFEDFRTIAKSTIIGSIAQICLLYIGTRYWGLRGTLYGFGLTYSIVWLYNYTQIRKHLSNLGNNLTKVLRTIRLNDFKIIYQFSLPIAISSLLSIPALWWSKTYLVQNCGFGSMASYDVAEQWRTQLLFVPAAISQVILPVISNIRHNGNHNDVFKAIKLNLVINISVTFIITLVIFVIGRYIIQAYGTDFNNPMPMYILALTGIIISITNVLGSLIISYNKTWQILHINLIWGVSLVILSIFFISLGYAENGLAMANLISYVIFLILLSFKSFTIFRRHFSINHE